MADEQIECEFLRFVGKRVTDPGTDERDFTIIDATANLGLRADATLLAISNKYGAIFAGTSGGFQWAWLSELRAACERDAVEKRGACDRASRDVQMMSIEPTLCM